MEEWKIVKDRGHGCCKRLKPPELFAVLDLPDCVRRDYCPACFRELTEALAKDGKRPPFFWRTKPRDNRRSSALDLTSLRLLFDRLGEEAGERPAALRYVVALLLLRKRVLKMADAPVAGMEDADLVVIDPKVEGMAPVALAAPPLGDGGLLALKDELLAALGAVDAPATGDQQA
jgi:hypothetical protein